MLILSFCRYNNTYYSKTIMADVESLENVISGFAQMMISRTNIRKVLEVQSKQKQELFNSSRGKNIVVFVGRTGSGKSTLINYLLEKELIVDGNENIVLRNPNDPSAMKIGVTHVSETLIPKFIECNQFLFYDLPGIGDTRGTAVNLVNAAFIKNLIENAERVGIVFVISQDEITAGRGELIKQLLSNLKILIPNETIEEISALIVTKSSAKRTVEQLVERLKEKTDGDTVVKWHIAGRLAKMELLNDNKINQNDRREILDAITKINKKRINTVNIGAIFNYTEQNIIKEIYIEEMQEIFDRFLLNEVDTTTIKTLSIPNMEVKKNQLKKLVDKCQFDSSPLIPLLRTISKDIYDLSLIEMRKLMSVKVDKTILLIDIEIKEKLRIKAQEEMEAEANRRRIAEQQRQKAEQDRLEEVKRREAIERENDPANWPITNENQTSTSISWGDEYLGDWEPYRGGSGLSRRTKHRKRFYEKELLTTTIKQRNIRKKNNSEMMIILNDWYVISSATHATGNIRATERFAY